MGINKRFLLRHQKAREEIPFFGRESSNNVVDLTPDSEGDPIDSVRVEIALFISCSHANRYATVAKTRFVHSSSVYLVEYEKQERKKVRNVVFETPQTLENSRIAILFHIPPC